LSSIADWPFYPENSVERFKNSLLDEYGCVFGLVCSGHFSADSVGQALANEFLPQLVRLKKAHREQQWRSM